MIINIKLVKFNSSFNVNLMQSAYKVTLQYKITKKKYYSVYCVYFKPDLKTHSSPLCSVVTVSQSLVRAHFNFQHTHTHKPKG